MFYNDVRYARKTLTRKADLESFASIESSVNALTLSNASHTDLKQQVGNLLSKPLDRYKEKEVIQCLLDAESVLQVVEVLELLLDNFYAEFINNFVYNRRQVDSPSNEGKLSFDDDESAAVLVEPPPKPKIWEVDPHWNPDGYVVYDTRDLDMCLIFRMGITRLLRLLPKREDNTLIERVFDVVNDIHSQYLDDRDIATLGLKVVNDILGVLKTRKFAAFRLIYNCVQFYSRGTTIVEESKGEDESHATDGASHGISSIVLDESYPHNVENESNASDNHPIIETSDEGISYAKSYLNVDTKAAQKDHEVAPSEENSTTFPSNLASNLPTQDSTETVGEKPALKEQSISTENSRNLDVTTKPANRNYRGRAAPRGPEDYVKLPWSGTKGVIGGLIQRKQPSANSNTAENAKKHNVRDIVERHEIISSSNHSHTEDNSRIIVPLSQIQHEIDSNPVAAISKADSKGLSKPATPSRSESFNQTARELRKPQVPSVIDDTVILASVASFYSAIHQNARNRDTVFQMKILDEFIGFSLTTYRSKHRILQYFVWIIDALYLTNRQINEYDDKDELYDLDDMTKNIKRTVKNEHRNHDQGQPSNSLVTAIAMIASDYSTDSKDREIGLRLLYRWNDNTDNFRALVHTGIDLAKQSADKST